MVELHLLAPVDRVELVSDALIDELEALSVSVEDADAQTPAEHALFGEPGMPPPAAGWQRSIVKALFDDEASATEAATLLLAQDWAEGVHVQSVQAVPDEDWVRLTQAQFSPVEIAPGFWVVPSWHTPPPEATRSIRLDPGLAFGTGTHPTTRMCLRWAADHAGESARWQRVLDYGCGSGILAIGAALFGAMQIDAVDIDPAAVESTRANARDNGRGRQRRLARTGAWRVPAGLREHSRQPAEAARTAAECARCAGRRPRARRHPRAPGRRVEGRVRAVARARGQQQHRRLDSDDGTQGA